MNARVHEAPRPSRLPDWGSETLEPAYAIVRRGAAIDRAAVEPLGDGLSGTPRPLQEQFAQQIDVAVRWQSFLNSVRRTAPGAASVVNAVVDGVRPLLDSAWPLGSLDLDDQVAISWEDHGQFYAHLDLCADGTGTWFGKNLRTGSYDGGEVTSPEQAREAMVAWLGTQDRAA